MYKNIDGNLAISVNDWLQAGLTYKQFSHDSERGFLTILRRGINGNTLIDARSIRRSDRLRIIEREFGKIAEQGSKGLYGVNIDTKAREWYAGYIKPDGSHLEPELITKYTNEASIFNALREGMSKQIEMRARSGKKLKRKDFWASIINWHTDEAAKMQTTIYSNVRSLERAFKRYLNDGYRALLHGNTGRDNARVVSRNMENLLLSLWRVNNKPFVKEVHELYMQFVGGSKELFDRETGEVYNPEDFRHEGKALEISAATVWNYLKNVVNNTAVYADRNGNFDYANSKRPKHNRQRGKYSLSKISMDDVALSRKSVRGWVYKYIAVDVVSGYYFRPAYVVGKPTVDTVYESFRNMFCELASLGLPMPGELEVEHHLMQDVAWLGEAFSFVRFCTSPTEKRAEHNIRSLKYGTAHREGHTRGRWYAKSEAFRSVRNKVDGDYTEPVYQPQTIVADDLADIEKHNNELHPLQKTYPGMTRREVLLKNINPQLQPIAAWYLYKFIGNETATKIYNNDYVPVGGEEFEITNFEMLNNLKPNNCEVTAYWLPNDEGGVEKVYLYQGETYIGEAVNRKQYAYNECAAERTAEDEAKMLHQNKRAAKFDKFIRTRREELTKIEQMDTKQSNAIAAAPVSIVENEQPKGYEEDEFTPISTEEMAKRAM